MMTKKQKIQALAEVAESTYGKNMARCQYNTCVTDTVCLIHRLNTIKQFFWAGHGRSSRHEL